MAYVIGEDCVACGTCQSACPTGAISEGDIYKIDPDVCISCGSCAEVCPSAEALKLRRFFHIFCYCSAQTVEKKITHKYI